MYYVSCQYWKTMNIHMWIYHELFSLSLFNWNITSMYTYNLMQSWWLPIILKKKVHLWICLAKVIFIRVADLYSNQLLTRCHIIYMFSMSLITFDGLNYLLFSSGSTIKLTNKQFTSMFHQKRNGNWKVIREYYSQIRFLLT